MIYEGMRDDLDTLPGGGDRVGPGHEPDGKLGVSGAAVHLR